MKGRSLSSAGACQLGHRGVARTALCGLRSVEKKAVALNWTPHISFLKKTGPLKTPSLAESILVRVDPNSTNTTLLNRTSEPSSARHEPTVAEPFRRKKRRPGVAPGTCRVRLKGSGKGSRRPVRPVRQMKWSFFVSGRADSRPS